MPTVDTTSRRWPSTDRSTEIKKAIKMLSAFQYLKKVCVVKAKELRTKDDASAGLRLFVGSVERKVAGRGRGSVRAGPGPNWGEATNCSPAHNATTAWRPIAGVEVPLGGEMVLGGERRAEKT